MLVLFHMNYFTKLLIDFFIAFKLANLFYIPFYRIMGPDVFIKSVNNNNEMPDDYVAVLIPIIELPNVS